MAKHMKIKGKIPKDLAIDLSNYARNTAEGLAVVTKDAFEKEYKYIISKFYNEYTPKVYIRHAKDYDPNTGSDGLFKTYRTEIKTVPYQSTLVASLFFETENMEEYKAPGFIVLETFLGGWHGPAYRGLHFGLYPLRHMEVYRDLIYKSIQAYVPAAIRYAQNKQSYTYIKF